MTNRDLTTQERETLERLIDATSIVAVMEALSDICTEKDEHILTNWQDKKLAKLWAHAAGVIGCASTTISRHI